MQLDEEHYTSQYREGLMCYRVVPNSSNNTQKDTSVTERCALHIWRGILEL